MQRAAELGCIACRAIGIMDSPSQLHHPRAKAGAGERGRHDECIPLCHAHHLGDYGIHKDPIGFKAKFGSEEDLTRITKDLINGTVILGRVRRD